MTMIDNGDGGGNGVSNENVNNTRNSINDSNDMSNEEEEENHIDIINDENSQTKDYGYQSSSSNIAIIGPGLAKVITYLQLLDPFFHLLQIHSMIVLRRIIISFYTSTNITLS